MDFRFEYAEHRGARIAYQVAGDGPAIVLMKNSRRPADFPAATLLAERFRVLQVHPIGFGASERPADYAFADIGPQVLAAADREDVEDFVVWGFSQCAAMAAMVAPSTERAVALVAGGLQLVDFPTEGVMRRMEREPRMPRPALQFWRAYHAIDWCAELRAMAQPKLVYIGARDPARSRIRRFEPALRHCGCDFLELPGLDHTTAGLAAEPADAETTIAAVTRWLQESLGPDW